MAGFPLFNRAALKIKSLRSRVHDLDISIIRQVNDSKCSEIHRKFEEVSRRVIHAKQNNSSIIFMIGGHVIRDGVQNYIIDLMERGYISCVAINGSVMIHDFEFALIGATTESVARYIREGQFGLWKETGRINDIINEGYRNGLGMGEAVGKAIYEGNISLADLKQFLY